MTDAVPPLRSFGRVRGRPLKPRQETLIDTLLPGLSLPTDARALAELASNATEVWLEIGFGAGEHLTGQAARRPQTLFLGAEPFLNGVGQTLAKIEDLGLRNVRLHAGDVREILPRLPDFVLDRVFILFPDPWPKTRHQKRRLIQPAFISDLTRVVRPGGKVRLATDWADYADQFLSVLIRSGGFIWTAERADDWRRPPSDHVTTRYEAKGLGDCPPVFLDFLRA